MSIKLVEIIDGSAGLLTASAVTYCTILANEATTVTKMTFTNTGAATTITGYKIPSGETAANQYKFIDAHPIGANETWSCPDIEGQVLIAGSFIQLLAADAARVAVVASGINVVQ